MDLDTFTTGLETHFLRLNNINKEIGWPESIYEEHTRSLLGQFVEIMETQLKISRSKKNELLKSCKEMEEEIVILKKRIGDEIQKEGDLKETREVGLIENLEKLKAEKEELHEVYQKRLEIVQNLRSKLDSFRPTLGNFISVPSLSDENPPSLSLDSIVELEKVYEKCHTEINIRRDHINSLVSAIVNLWTDLGIKTENELDESILQHYRATVDRHMIIESADNIETLEMKKKKLETQKRQALSRVSDMFSEINVLWDKFSITAIERNKFLEEEEKTKTLSDALYKHEVHLKMLHETKIENCERHIQSAREKLILLWDALLFGEEERKAFTPAFSSNYNDESLAAHEAEIEKLKQLLEKLKPVLDVVTKHFRLTTELKEVEQSVKDPSWLIERGSEDHGRLLREEKIRKKLEKEVPKLENEVESLLRRWEARHRKVFLVFGKRYLDFIEECKKIRRESGIKTSIASKYSASAVSDTNRAPLKNSSPFHSSLVKSTTNRHFMKLTSAPGYSSASSSSRKTQIPPSNKMSSPPPFVKRLDDSPKISATVPTPKKPTQRNGTLMTKIPIATAKTLNRSLNSQIDTIKPTVSLCVQESSNHFSGEPPNCVINSQILAAQIEVEKVFTDEHHGSTTDNANELHQTSTSTKRKNKIGKSAQRIAGSARKIKMLNSMPALAEVPNHMNSELETIEANKYIDIEYLKKDPSLVSYHISPNSNVGTQSPSCSFKVVDTEDSLQSI